MSSKLTPIAGVAALAMYSFAAVRLSSNSDISKHMSKFAKPKHAEFGALRFLTYQTLVAQIVNAVLHVLASFVPKLRCLRDLWHSALAFPLSVFVASTFWIVYIYDRELIFPAVLDEFFPVYLNHVVHTVIVFTNLAYILLEHHHYYKHAYALMLAHLVGYLSFLLHIKLVTGFFVYPYLDAIGFGPQLYAYFASCLVYIFLLYKLGELLSLVLQPKRLLDARKSAGHKSKKQN